MPFSHHDAPTVLLLQGAFEEAWFTLPTQARWSPLCRADTIAAMTRQLLAAADAGERDHGQLVQAALEGVDATAA
jgi:hypothetical protein